LGSFLSIAEFERNDRPPHDHGRLSEALRALAEKAGTRDVMTALYSRLELYRRHKPFRDSTRAETAP